MRQKSSGLVTVCQLISSRPILNKKTLLTKVFKSFGCKVCCHCLQITNGFAKVDLTCLQLFKHFFKKIFKDHFVLDATHEYSNGVGSVILSKRESNASWSKSSGSPQSVKKHAIWTSTVSSDSVICKFLILVQYTILRHVGKIVDSLRIVHGRLEFHENGCHSQ